MKFFVAAVVAALAVAFVAAEETVPINVAAEETVPVKVAVKDAVPDFPAKVHTPTVTKFTTKYDDVSLDEILKSERLLNNYFDCLMDSKPCTPDGNELKKAIPLALKNDCSGCSEKQRAGAETVIKFLAENKPQLWRNLEDKYDPEHVYRTKHVELAAKKGIIL